MVRHLSACWCTKEVIDSPGEYNQFLEMVKSCLLDPKSSKWYLKRNLGDGRLTLSSASLVCYALFLFLIVNATLSLPGKNIYL